MLYRSFEILLHIHVYEKYLLKFVNYESFIGKLTIYMIDIGQCT